MADKNETCEVCGGTGVIEVPSMLGYGTEVYPCKCHALAERLEKAVIEATHAWIDRNIR